MNPGGAFLGIDEAGRGCVLGSLFLAGVLIPDEDGINQLLSWGVQDSKKFGAGAAARKKREDLFHKITSNFPHLILEATPPEIDHAVRVTSLNVLEREKAKIILDHFKFGRAVLDGKSIFSALTLDDHILAVNKADDLFPEVAAASILAKHLRDKKLETIYEETFGITDGLPGGGYANAKTAEILRGYMNKKGELPGCYRASYNWDYSGSEKS